MCKGPEAGIHLASWRDYMEPVWMEYSEKGEGSRR